MLNPRENIEWMRRSLVTLGLLRRREKWLLLGLSGAGKTTLLSKLTSDYARGRPPTNETSSHEFEIDGAVSSIIDIGSTDLAESQWKEYLPGTTGIIFIADVTEEDRLLGAQDELWRLTFQDELKDVPFLVLGNNIDKPKPLGDDDVSFLLGIHNLEKVNSKYFMCSLVRGEGYEEVLSISLVKPQPSVIDPNGGRVTRDEEPASGRVIPLPWQSYGQVLIGLRSELHLDDPNNRTNWRRDRHIGMYHNVRPDNEGGAGKGASQSNAGTLFLDRVLSVADEGGEVAKSY
ncbi:ADP-ribosylation factor family-domain-containing protein [Daldinia sp. FL1419]|nr:ADP-ribosylation factor family-domain-containing protein [Daldinia sp. FL1419]